jgi:DNA-binding NarL/FixJ family response regulator
MLHLEANVIDTAVADSKTSSGPATSIGVLFADDHFVVRQGLRDLLESDPRCKVLGEARTGREVVSKAIELKPDVVILDVRMPELNGIEATRQIRSVAPQSKVLVLTMHDSEHLVRELLQAGALGYLLKTDAARDLVMAVESLYEGRPFFTSPVAKMVLQGYLSSRPQIPEVGVHGSLTPREREVVQLLAEGRSNKEIAASLGISVKTAETHRANIMRALNLRSICDLVHYAVREEIIQA